MPLSGERATPAGRVMQAVTGIVVGTIVLAVVLVLNDAHNANPIFNGIYDIGSGVS